jgi:hypothetical protein
MDLITILTTITIVLFFYGLITHLLNNKTSNTVESFFVEGEMVEEEIAPEMIEEEIIPEITEEIVPEITEEIEPEVKEEIAPGMTEEIAPEKIEEEIEPVMTEEIDPEAYNSETYNQKEIESEQSEVIEEELNNLERTYTQEESNSNNNNANNLHNVKPFNSGYLFRNRNQEGTLNYFGPNIVKRYYIKPKQK